MGAPGLLSRLSVSILILAQAVISWFVRLSTLLGSAWAMQSLLGILSFPISAPPLLTHTLSILKQINKLNKKVRAKMTSDFLAIM